MKKLKVIALILVAVMLLSACGEAIPKNKEPLPEPKPEPAEEQPSEQKTSTVTQPAAEPEKNNVNAVSEQGTEEQETNEKTVTAAPTTSIGYVPSPEQVLTKKIDDDETTMGDMGIRLVDAIAEHSDGNVILSDLSVNMALCMILEGASGNTQRVLEDYLGVKKEDAAKINKEILSKLNDSEREELKVVLANSVWIRENLDVKQNFIDTMTDDYSAAIASVDMNNPETAKKINDWCNEKTNGLIPSVVDADMIRGMAAVLVNALYFKGTWTDEFGDARDGEFGGKPAKMMRGDATSYMENDKAIGFAKYYYGGYKFVGILPKSEGEFTLAELNIPSLLDSSTTEYDVRVTMPKFENTFDIELKKVLYNLGLSNIFGSGADFSGIAPDLFVSEIIHKTQFNLDEYGTEAAAVTAIVMDEATAFMPDEVEIKEVILDRPFAFVLMDPDGNALFTGKVVSVDA